MNVVRPTIAIALCGTILRPAEDPDGGEQRPQPWTQAHVLRLGELDEPDSLNPFLRTTRRRSRVRRSTAICCATTTGNYIPTRDRGADVRERGISKTT